MAKRKRVVPAEAAATAAETKFKGKKVKTTAKQKQPESSKPAEPLITIQIVAGSYDRILHGMAATITPDTADFTDTFLLEPHTSSIRAVALSPPSAPVKGQEQKIILASGSTDEQIKLYHISAHPPNKAILPAMPSFARKAAVENPNNRQLGSLLHHAGPITSLQFPTRSKLLSSSEDCTIAVTRTRDWSLLSNIKAPVPKPMGRPSGDTAPPGATPAGVNDFAIHPSMKLMISVGKGEKCMRLWNLVTGKKAGVLNFGRDLLMAVGEGRYSSGEGRKVCWGASNDGEEFGVVFERGVVVFGMDSKPRCKAVPEPRTKIHQVTYLSTSDAEEASLLTMSTEDGRILFYSTQPDDLISVETKEMKDTKLKEASIPSARLIAQLGGKDAKISGRVKDFVALKASELPGVYFFITAGSDGAIRVWRVAISDLESSRASKEKIQQVGKVLGEYKTENRITCLAAFVMLPRPSSIAADDLPEDLDVVEDDNESSNSDSE